ncbi:MAG: hypothetical protein WC879_03550 [Melioribacteraceae bacterium]
METPKKCLIVHGGNFEDAGRSDCIICTAKSYCEFSRELPMTLTEKIIYLGILLFAIIAALGILYTVIKLIETIENL